MCKKCVWIFYSRQLQDEYVQDCGGVVPSVDYNVNPSVRQGYAPPAPQSGVVHAPPAPQPGVVHAQYNTPLGMYSNKNVNDSFHQQADVMKNEFGK